MLQNKAEIVSTNIINKITYLIADEITDSYKDDRDFDYFEIDYEYIKAIVLYKMIRSSAVKASSPVSPNREMPPVGINLN